MSWFSMHKEHLRESVDTLYLSLDALEEEYERVYEKWSSEKERRERLERQYDRLVALAEDLIPLAAEQRVSGLWRVLEDIRTDGKSTKREKTEAS